MAAMTASSLWAGLFKEIDNALRDPLATAKEAIHFITKFGCYTFPREASDPETKTIVGDYLAWLDENGTPLEKFPDAISESDLVHPALLLDAVGRRVSTMFLFHLCIAMRLQPFLPEAPRILEIGGGYGGLGRLAKLLWPGCTYAIVDLKESLRFSELFLKESFPSARIDTGSTGANGVPKIADFSLVAADSTQSIEGFEFDVVVNTCSFGEMTQSVVDAYHDLFEHRINARYLYSINRFGHRPFGDIAYQAPRDAGVDTAHMPFHPSGGWDVRVWDCWNESGFAEIELAAAPYLEVLLERVRTHDSTPERLLNKANRLRCAARNMTPGTSAWHYCLWNALRYYPTKSVAETYLNYLKTHRWPEATFFEGIRQNVDVSASSYGELETGEKSILLDKMNFTRLSRTHPRRINERIAQLKR